MEPKNSKEVYALFVKIVRTCTGLNESAAREALALNGVSEPEEVFEPEPTPVIGTPIVTPEA